MTKVWGSLGSGFNSSCLTLAIHPITGELYAGGEFTQAGGNPGYFHMG